MAGLLDFLPEDKNERAAVLQGLLGAGFGMMQGARNPGGSFAPAFGAGGMQGMQAYQGAIEGQQARQMREMQMGEIKRKQVEAERQRAILEQIGSQPIVDRAQLAQQLIKAGQVDEGVKMLTERPEKQPDWMNPEYEAHLKRVDENKANLQPKKDWMNPEYEAYQKRIEKYKAGLRPTNEPKSPNMSVTAQKELIQTEEEVQGGGQALQFIQQAKDINKRAMGFTGAGAIASVGSILPDAIRPNAVDATQELDNITQNIALPQLKAIFGGMPTEGERKILLEMQGSSGKPAKVRDAIFERAEQAVKNRLKFAGEKRDRLRSGTYFSGEPVNTDLAEQKPKAPRTVKTEAEALMLPKGTEFLLNGRKGVRE